MSDNITYNHGGVADFASDVGSRSAQLMEIHDDILQRTNAIADFFQGSAAASFHEAQVQMLQGMADSEERIARSRERERQYQMLVRTGKVADFLP